MGGTDPVFRAGETHLPPPGRLALTRRQGLRGAALAAGVALGGAVLAGCAGRTRTSAAAAPTKAAAAVIHLLWRPWYNFTGSQTTAGHALLLQGIEPWLATHPGVDVTITYLGYQGTTVSALLAGQGPDVFADWVIPDFDTGSTHLLLDLSKYVRQDNVDLTIFPKFEIQFYSQDGGLIALPSYFHLQAPAVDLGALDNLGLTYPETGWTYTEWANLYRSATVKSSDPTKARIGGEFIWSGYDGANGNPHAYYLAGFGGEYIDPSNRSRGYLEQPGSVACLQWLYGLINEGACDTGGAAFPGRKTVGSMDTAGGLVAAASALRSTKWQIYDEPTYPAARTAYVWTDFYGISASTAQPDLSWELLRYLCVEPDWQRWMVKLALNGPNQKALYSEWAATVREVAPPLANVDLEVFTRQMENNEPYFGVIVPYADTQTGAVINSALAPAQKDLTALPSGVQQADQRVDALQAAQALIAGAAVGEARQFPTTGPVIAGAVAGV